MNIDFDPDATVMQLLVNLEKDMHLQGDNRHTIIKEVLDYLHEHKIINLDYQPKMLSMAQSNF